jgi:hypothetical protein
MNQFDTVFAELRRIMLDAGKGQVVSRDEAGDLVLRTREIDPKTGEAGWFGTVTIKKSYVAYHLMPLYADPGLANGVSEGLRKRQQGKTCFNFKTVDADLFSELAALTAKANGTKSL